MDGNSDTRTSCPTTPPRSNQPETADLISYLETRAFNLKMLDGALIQLSYEFVDGTLERYRLGFLPSPSLLAFQNDPDIYLNDDQLFADVIEKQAVTVPVRFDYDCRDGVAESLKHPTSHLTLGQYSRCRIPVVAPVTPYYFVEFIIRSFYNTAAFSVAADLPPHRYDVDACITPEETALIHVSLPSSPG